MWSATSAWRSALDEVDDPLANQVLPVPKAMSYKRMKELKPVLAAEVEKWLNRAEREDTAEDEQFGAERRGDELPQWVADKAQRLAAATARR